MYITAQGCRLRNDLYCVEWDVTLYYTIPYHTTVGLAHAALRTLAIQLELNSLADWKPVQLPEIVIR